MPQERLQMLSAIAQKQEQLIQQGGLSNPLAGLPEYRNTLARMLETVNIADISSYFKALPPDFAPPPQPPPPPNTDLILADVQNKKTNADIENTRADQQTKRASLLLEDDRERDKSALDAWTRAWIAGATSNIVVPSLEEFKAAMKSNAPAVGLLSDLPPPTSPQPPAVGAPQPKPPQGPQGMPMMPPGPPRPSMMPQPQQRPLAPPSGPIDPQAAANIRQSLATGRLPTAYGQLTERASRFPLMGPGGPSLPQPGGNP
jgi:hypothetical protein